MKGKICCAKYVVELGVPDDDWQQVYSAEIHPDDMVVIQRITREAKLMSLPKLPHELLHDLKRASDGGLLVRTGYIVDGKLWDRYRPMSFKVAVKKPGDGKLKYAMKGALTPEQAAPLLAGYFPK